MKRGIRITVEHAPSATCYPGDVSRMKQLLRELLADQGYAIHADELSANHVAPSTDRGVLDVGLDG